MNVIGYVRVSTQGQVKDGYSLSYQQDEIRSYCEQQGWHLVQVFTDEGISGAKVDEEALEVEREGFQDMLTYVSSHKVDYVVVLNTSRLWRSDIVKVLVHRELKKRNIDIRSIEQPTYSIFKKDPSDFLINGLMELLDAYQRLEIAMKLGRGRNKRLPKASLLVEAFLLVTKENGDQSKCSLTNRRHPRFSGSFN